MAHHWQPHLPTNQEEATQWVERDSPLSFKNAALLNKLQLGADEKGILHMGCGYGMLAISAFRVLQSLSQHPANIVGVDICRPLIERAFAAVADESSRHPSIRDLVTFRALDVRGIGDQANIDMIRLLFPRGLSTIIVTDIFEKLSDEDTFMVVRDVMALLPPGGRLVFDTYDEPLVWGGAQLITRSLQPNRLVAIVCLVSPRGRTEAGEQARRACQHINGTSSSGAVVHVREVDCHSMCRVWEEFSGLPTIDAVPPYDPARGGPARFDDGSVFVNDEAAFNPAQRRFYNTRREFSVRYFNRFTQLFEGMLEMLATRYVGLEDVDHFEARAVMANRLMGGFALRLERQLREHRADLFRGPNDYEGAGVWRAITELLASHESARNITGVPTPMQPDYCFLCPHSTLVILRRA